LTIQEEKRLKLFKWFFPSPFFAPQASSGIEGLSLFTSGVGFAGMRRGIASESGVDAFHISPAKILNLNIYQIS